MIRQDITVYSFENTRPSDSTMELRKAGWSECWVVESKLADNKPDTVYK